MRDEQEVRVVRHMIKKDVEGPHHRLMFDDVIRNERLRVAQEVLSWVLGAPLPWLESVLTDEEAAPRCP